MKFSEGMAVVEAVLFACGEPIEADKLAAAAEIEKETVLKIIDRLNDRYADNNSAFHINRLGESYQMMTQPEFAPYISKVLEQRKPPMLSQPALETLAVVAYFQPVTRAYVEQVRGVDSSYTVSALCERGLIEECGRLEVPGRPAIFRTTDVFLRTMGISSLAELPPLPDMTNGEGIEKLQSAINKLQDPGLKEQISLSEITGETVEE